MRVTWVLLAALVLVPNAGAWTRLPLAEQVASEIAGRPVEVRCYSQSEWPQSAAPHTSGYVWWQDGTPMYVALSPETCWSLILLAFDPGNTAGAATMSSFNAKAVWEEGQAALVLAHEAVHMQGVMDEAVTECRALNYTDLVLQRFGVTTRMDSLRHDVQMAHAIAPASYRRVC